MDAAKKVTVWYLHHSGFAVKTEKHMLVFDYENDLPVRLPRSLETGVFKAEDFADDSVRVFCSHRHGDHYNRTIFEWENEIKDIRYYLSDDIRRPPASKNVRKIAPGQKISDGGLEIRTLPSTDVGVAFLVKADGVTIYHAGDLNWWHWEGEPDDQNRRMAEKYRAQMEALSGTEVDLAFLPFDPRLGDSFLLGPDSFMKTVGARYVVPMHFWDDMSAVTKAKRDPRTNGYAERILPVARRGQRFELEFD